MITCELRNGRWTPVEYDEGMIIEHEPCDSLVKCEEYIKETKNASQGKKTLQEQTKT